MICIVVSIRNNSPARKVIYSNGSERVAKNISPYLADASNLIVSKRREPLSSLPLITYGNKAVDGGNLILSKTERDELLLRSPVAEPYVKKLIGSREFINGLERYCLWIEDSELDDARKVPAITKRIKAVEKMRLDSRDAGANRLALRSHQFRDFNRAKKRAIVIPKVSSERREYIPVGFIDNETIITDLAFAIYDPPTWVFALVGSRIHAIWVKSVGGRMKTDYRYSSVLCYNTFPFPKTNDNQKTELEEHVFDVLDQREAYPELTLANLYDPDKMPDSLREAHDKMDLAIERCYRKKPFSSDEGRLEYLFKLYETMTKKEAVCA